MWLLKFRKNKRGISTVITVILSLVILVIVIENVVIWGYNINQYDWERMHENLSILNVTSGSSGGSFFAFENNGPLTVQVVSIWVDNLTLHSHYDVDYFINSGVNASFFNAAVNLPEGQYIVKAVTSRGNISILPQR
ncbi:MAG TPA: hypothetical protein VK487_01715 [Candidatus Bathyarchaeia archaeon]|nr:hypothetical protein [Candidatus Bathyarchaeia archaeon]